MHIFGPKNYKNIRYMTKIQLIRIWFNGLKSQKIYWLHHSGNDSNSNDSPGCSTITENISKDCKLPDWELLFTIDEYFLTV